jgi:uncharacterized protein
MGSAGAAAHIAPKHKPWERHVSHLPQDLHDIFPAAAHRLRLLKETDRHFRTLADRYAALDDEIRRSETGVAAAMDDAHAEELKRERLALLDQIAAILEGEKA